jgi:hypothetical protein
VLASTVVASPASKLARRLLRRNLFMCSSRVRAVPLWPPHVSPAPTGGPALARVRVAHTRAGGGSVVRLPCSCKPPPNDTAPADVRTPQRLGNRPVTEGSRLVTRPILLVNTQMRKNRKVVSGDGQTPLASVHTGTPGPPETPEIGSVFPLGAPPIGAARSCPARPPPRADTAVRGHAATRHGGSGTTI